MPGVRGLRARDVIPAFERAGGIRRGGKGDHINIKMPNGKILTFRAVGEVKIGILKKALRLAGITEQEFEDNLR